MTGRPLTKKCIIMIHVFNYATRKRGQAGCVRGRDIGKRFLKKATRWIVRESPWIGCLDCS